jgi:hypothetical protein
MSDIVKTYTAFVNESAKFPHEIKSERYWRNIIGNDPYLIKILNTIMTKQNSFASDSQMQLLRRRQNGETSPYSAKN